MENVIIKFVADTEGLQPAIKQLELLGKITADDAAKFNQINQEQKEFIQGLNKSTTEMGKLSTEVEGLMAEIQAGVMEGFAEHLEQVTKETAQSAKGFKSMKQELRELKAQIASGSLGEKELRSATKRAAELQDAIGDVNDKVKALASDTKRIDAMVTAFRGLAGAISVSAGAASLFGTENENLTKTLAKAQGAMALLQGVQELANIATTEGALKTMVLDGAQKAAAISSRALGVTISASMAMATAGISLLVAGLAYLVITMDDAEESATNMNKALEMDAASRYRNIEKLNDMMVDSLDKRLLVSKQAHQRELAELQKQFNEKKLSQAAYQNAVAIEDDSFLARQQKIRDDWANQQASKEKQHQERIRQIRKQANDNFIKDQELQIRNEIANFEILMRETADVTQKQAYFAEITRLRKAQVQLDASLTENEKILQKELLDDQLAAYREFYNNYDELSVESEAKVTENTVLAWKLRIDRIKKLQADADKYREEQIKMWSKFAIDQAQVVADTVFTINQQNRQAEVDSQLAMLTQMRDNELSNKNLTDAQKAKLELKYQREEARIKQQAWEAEKQAALAQAAINTALAVTKAWATVPPPANLPAAIAAGVAGAAQIAIIQNQQPPKFAEGVINLQGAGTGTSDHIDAKLSKGESVLTARTTADYLPAITAIHNGEVEPTLANNILTALADGTFGMAQWQHNDQPILDYYKLAQIVERGKSVVNINMDENGFTKTIERAGSRVSIKNRKFRAQA